MTDQRRSIIFLALGTVFLIFSINIGSKLPADIEGLLRPAIVAEDSTTLARLSLINSAVKLPADKTYFTYTGGFENPFRKQGASANVRPGGKASVASQRIRLALKGILSKDRPIAILENIAGETFIRGVGEKAGDQTVVSIKGNCVTLRDHLGTYDVVVEEN